MDIRFDGKRALVTGAGKGIGKALTLKLVECGAEVVAVSRTQSDLEALQTLSPKIQTICLDIGDWDATLSALENVGPVDLLVNNAGIMETKEYGSYSEQDVDRTMNINVKAVINITQILVTDMKDRGAGGAVVNVSSMMGLQACAFYGVYCASKGALDQLTKSMSIEFGPHNIRVNSVNPTAVRTRIAEEVGMFDESNEFANNMKMRIPLRRLAETKDVVNAILFLLSDKAAMITGITLPVDGGLAVNYP